MYVSYSTCSGIERKQKLCTEIDKINKIIVYVSEDILYIIKARNVINFYTSKENQQRTGRYNKKKIKNAEKTSYFANAQRSTLSHSRIGLYVDAYRYVLCYLMSSLAARYIEYNARRHATLVIPCTRRAGQTEKRTRVYSNTALLTQPTVCVYSIRKTAMTDPRGARLLVII